LRWDSPTLGFVSPAEFIPIAEQAGLIVAIGNWVLRNACIEAAGWTKLDHPPIQVGVNLSALQFLSGDLAEKVCACLDESGLASELLDLELTESMLVENPEQTICTLDELKKQGLTLSMDDFGTGYSSLDVLSQLPFSALKLDQGVVGRMTEDSKNTHIVRSSLQLARELSIKVIAEGVETEGVYSFLLASGCNEAQGFWMARPMPIEEFIALLKQKPKWPSSDLGFLYNAWVNHLSYRRKVLDTVYTMTMTQPEEWASLPKLDLRHSPAHCRLGQWYRDMSNTGFSEDTYRTLEDVHRQMHTAGDALLKTVASELGTEAVIAATGDFLGFSEKVDQEVSRIVALSFAQSLRENDQDTATDAKLDALG